MQVSLRIHPSCGYTLNYSQFKNAVALTRVRSKTSGTTNTENNEGALDESYLQSKKRASLDDKKFQGFWEVVESGVLLNEQSKFAKGDGHQGHSLHISEDGVILPIKIAIPNIYALSSIH